MGNPGNIVNGLKFEKINPKGTPSVYRVVILEEGVSVGSVRREGNVWGAYNEDFVLLSEFPHRQDAAEHLRNSCETSSPSIFSWEADSSSEEEVAVPEPTIPPEAPKEKKAPKVRKEPKKARKGQNNAKEKVPSVSAPKIPLKSPKDSRKGFSPLEMVVGPEPQTDHPPRVSWKGTGDRKMFPSSLRGEVKKNQKFRCEEMYVNGIDELTYIIDCGNNKYAEVPACHFRVLKG